MSGNIQEVSNLFALLVSQFTHELYPCTYSFCTHSINVTRHLVHLVSLLHNEARLVSLQIWLVPERKLKRIQRAAPPPVTKPAV